MITSSSAMGTQLGSHWAAGQCEASRWRSLTLFGSADHLDVEDRGAEGTHQPKPDRQVHLSPPRGGDVASVPRAAVMAPRSMMSPWPKLSKMPLMRGGIRFARPCGHR